MLHQEKWTFKEHLPYQAFYLAFKTGYMPVLLFLPLYLKYVGLTTTQVGLIAGLRPLLQAIGTPILIKLCTKLHARKLLFIISCFLMLGKFFTIFVVLRPEQEVCRIKYSNGQIQDRFAKHAISKRSVVMDEWLQVLNFTPSELSFEYHDTNKLTKLQNDTTDKNYTWSTVQPETIQTSPGQSSNTTNTSAALTNRTSTMQYRFDHAVDTYRIFIVIVILTVATDMFDSCIHSLVDDVYRPNVPWMWGNMAWAVMTVIIGIVVDRSSQIICGEMIGSFHYVFYFNLAFVAIALLIGACLNFTVNPYEADLASKVLSSKLNFQYNIFILAYTLMGFCNGFLFTFVYWFIDIRGGNALIMGLSTTTECLIGILLFVLANRLIEYTGHLSAVCIGFVGYIGLFLSYYGIENPWLVVAAKVLQGLVSAIMMFACNSFRKGTAPAGSSYQLQGNKYIYISQSVRFIAGSFIQ